MNLIPENPILFTITATLLWVIWYYIWKPHALDKYRHELFVTRDRLLEETGSGKIPLQLSDPAYQSLRNEFNNSIRFAHEATVVRLVSFLILTALWKMRGQSNFEERFENAAEDSQDCAGPEMQKIVKKYQNDRSNHTFKYLCKTSPIFLVGVVGLFLAVFIFVVAKAFLSLFNRSVLNPLADGFDIVLDELTRLVIDPTMNSFDIQASDPNALMLR